MVRTNCVEDVAAPIRSLGTALCTAMRKGAMLKPMPAPWMDTHSMTVRGLDAASRPDMRTNPDTRITPPARITDL
ncbi:MAG: hypothetical protein A2902_03595 [Elusimicrobia bacterium RIFCSPLOWO2_01_FULL_64_13]|nr:MAG: hypothetical protein A2902_03595 [Elusimicrobia bacterium RIFCSPLOWO2_01_FULL_64_13]